MNCKTFYRAFLDSSKQFSLFSPAPAPSTIRVFFGSPTSPQLLLLLWTRLDFQFLLPSSGLSSRTAAPSAPPRFFFTRAPFLLIESPLSGDSQLSPQPCPIIHRPLDPPKSLNRCRFTVPIVFPLFRSSQVTNPHSDSPFLFL